MNNFAPLFQTRIVRTKFDIYVFITITGSIPLLVDYLISTFLLLSLGRYHCWWTITPRGGSRAKRTTTKMPLLYIKTTGLFSKTPPLSSKLKLFYQNAPNSFYQNGTFFL